MADFNDKQQKIYDGAYDKGEKAGGWTREHPVLTVLIIGLLILMLPMLFRFMFNMFIVIIFLILAAAMAYATIKIIDDVKNDIENNGTTETSANNANNDAVLSWKAKESHAPEKLVKLAKTEPLARAVASEYDLMMTALQDTGKKPELIQMEYESRMTSMIDGLALYAKVRKNKKNYPDADELLDKTEKAASALIRQFHGTVKDANADAVIDTKLKMQSIINTAPVDASNEIIHDTPNIDNNEK